MRIFKINILKEYSIFIWLIIVAIVGILITTIYSRNKLEQSELIKSTLDNIYLKKA